MNRAQLEAFANTILDIDGTFVSLDYYSDEELQELIDRFLLEVSSPESIARALHESLQEI